MTGGCDRSIANALTPLRLTLDAAVAGGLLDANPAGQVVLPRRRSGRAWATRERRYLTRAELVRLLDEVPVEWRPLFELLAATGLRVSEATGLATALCTPPRSAPGETLPRHFVEGLVERQWGGRGLARFVGRELVDATDGAQLAPILVLPGREKGRF